MKKFLIILGFCLMAGGIYFMSSQPARELANDESDELSSMGGSGSSSPGAAAGDSASAESPAGGASSAGAAGIANAAGTTSTGRNPSAVSASAAALARLQQISNKPWDIRRDSFSDSVRTLESGHLPRTTPEQFISEFSQSLFGVPSEHLIESKREVTERTKVVYEQKINGLKVYGGTLTLFFEGDALTRVQNDLASNEKLNAPPRTMSASEIVRFLDNSARQASQARGEKILPTVTSYKSAPAEAEMMLYPGSNSLVHVYKIAVQESRKGQRPKAFYAIVNAEDLRIIAKKPFHMQ